jgi:AcrR family transcriptional regulator
VVRSVLSLAKAGRATHHQETCFGTLYRHFPTQEALIDAAYRHQLTRVCEKAPDLLAQHPAAEATRMWMEHFLNYATAKSGMSAALNAVIASGVDPYADRRALHTDAVATLLEPAPANRRHLRR